MHIGVKSLPQCVTMSSSVFKTEGGLPGNQETRGNQVGKGAISAKSDVHLEWLRVNNGKDGNCRQKEDNLI